MPRTAVGSHDDFPWSWLGLGLAGVTIYLDESPDCS